MADKTNTEATVTEAPTETAETTIEEVSSTSDEKEEKTEARQSSATNGSGDKEDDSQEKQGSKEENVAKVEENIVSQENVQENESQDKTETTEQPSSRKSTPPKITVASAEQGLTSVAATDSEVIQSSAQTNSENDSTAVATDEKKSDPDKETVLPDASGSVVNKEDSKRPATEPARKVGLLHYSIHCHTMHVKDGGREIGFGTLGMVKLACEFIWNGFIAGLSNCWHSYK